MAAPVVGDNPTFPVMVVGPVLEIPEPARTEKPPAVPSSTSVCAEAFRLNNVMATARTRPMDGIMDRDLPVSAADFLGGSSKAPASLRRRERRDEWLESSAIFVSSARAVGLAAAKMNDGSVIFAFIDM